MELQHTAEGIELGIGMGDGVARGEGVRGLVTGDKHLPDFFGLTGTC